MERVAGFVELFTQKVPAVREGQPNKAIRQKDVRAIRLIVIVSECETIQLIN